MIPWVLRVLWISLPVTAGQALGDAIGGFADGPRLVAAVLLWAGWAAVLSATLVPRPIALTITRLGTPVAFVVATLAALSGRASTPASIVAVVVTAATAALGTRGEFARVCAQGAAYGDEERFPLTIPATIGAIILPLAVIVAGAGIATGPLLLADRHWVAGAIAIVLGLPASWLTARTVHQLSRRWIVLVPAGLVVADPLTLTDPVLFPRAHIAGLGPADPARRPPAEAVDLRLGAAFGSCALLLTDAAHLMRRVRGQGVGVETSLILVTPAGAPRLLDRASARRIPVRRD